MNLYNAPSVPVTNFMTDSPRGILKDAALKADRKSFSRSIFYYPWGIKYDADDVVTKTIINVESFIRSIIKWGIFLSAVAVYALGTTTGGIVAGSIALSSILVIRTLSNKLSSVKDEYAKVYTWGTNHFRSVFGAILTNVPVMTYKLVNERY